MIDAEEAIKASSRVPSRKWPHPVNAEQRLAPFCVPQIEPKFRLSADTTFFTVGSCFARNIEAHLRKVGLFNYADTESFDFMTGHAWGSIPLNKYTPLGILHEFHTALELDDAALKKQIIKVDEGSYYDPNIFFHQLSSFDEVYSARVRVRDLFRNVSKADVAIITLGQIECWWDRETDAVIDSSLAKAVLDAFPGRFAFKLLSLTECRETVYETLELLQRHNPDQRYILTTSPVPAQRTYQEQDAMMAYLHAKSMLRAVAQDVADSSDKIDYFPSFEMVVMSDRQLAFDKDMIHVRDGLVSRIVTRFLTNYIDIENGGEIQPKLGLLQAGELRHDGDIDGARELLEGISGALGENPSYLSEYALVAARCEDFNLARRLLDKLDEVSFAAENVKPEGRGTRDQNAQYEYNRAFLLFNKFDYPAAGAQGLILLNEYRDLILDTENRPVLAGVLDLLFLVKEQFLFQIFDPEKLCRQLEMLASEEEEDRMRAVAEGVIQHARNNDGDACRAALELCVTDHLPAIAQPRSADVRAALMPLAEVLDIPDCFERLKRLDKLASEEASTSPLI